VPIKETPSESGLNFNINGYVGVLISQLAYLCIPTRLSTGEHVTIKYYDITIHSLETSEATE
jgi:hypothetical protein